MALDWSQCPAVESIPGKVGGAWVFKGTRMPVSVVFENLEDAKTIEELMEQFPVWREEVKAVLEFAARSVVWMRPSASPRCACCWTPAFRVESLPSWQLH
jgi:uncharacterized protein (DUF433 family)